MTTVTVDGDQPHRIMPTAIAVSTVASLEGTEQIVEKESLSTFAPCPRRQAFSTLT